MHCSPARPWCRQWKVPEATPHSPFALPAMPRAALQHAVAPWPVAPWPVAVPCLLTILPVVGHHAAVTAVTAIGSVRVHPILPILPRHAVTWGGCGVGGVVEWCGWGGHVGRACEIVNACALGSMPMPPMAPGRGALWPYAVCSSYGSTALNAGVITCHLAHPPWYP